MANRPDASVLSIDAHNVLVFGGRAIGEPRVGRKSGSGTVDFTAAQSVDEITRKDDALTLSTGQVTFDEMIDPSGHRFADFCPETAAVESGLFGEKLAIDPRRARR